MVAETKRMQLYLGLVIFIAVITLILGILILTACGGKPEAIIPGDTDVTGDSTSEPISQPETEQKNEDVIEIVSIDEIDELFTAEPTPLKLEIATRQEDEKVGVIGPKGGEITYVTENGTELKLTLPENSVLTETEIKIIPIEEIENDPASTQFVAGIIFEPEGLVLIEPATLSIRFNKTDYKNKLAVFAFKEDGEDAHGYPYFLSTDQANTIEIPVFHFSGWTVGSDDGSSPSQNSGYPRSSHSPSSIAEALISEILRDVVERQHNGEEASIWDSEYKLEEIIAKWTKIVSGILKNAAENERTLERAIGEWYNLTRWSQWLDADETNPLMSEAATAIKFTIDQSSTRCSEEHDVAEVEHIQEWGFFNLYFSFDDYNNIDVDELLSKIEACHTFSLSFLSHLDSQFALEPISASSIIDVEMFDMKLTPYNTTIGVTTFSLEESMGNQPIRYVSVEGEAELVGADGSACTGTYTGGKDDVFTAYLFLYNIGEPRSEAWRPRIKMAVAYAEAGRIIPDSEESEDEPPAEDEEAASPSLIEKACEGKSPCVALVYDPGNLEEITEASCLGESGSGKDTTWQAQYWGAGFWDTYEIFGEKSPPGGMKYATVMDYLGGEEYARWEFDDCFDNGGGQTCYDHTLTLEHKPGK